MTTATLTVSLLLVVLFSFAGSIKLLGIRQSLAIRDRLKISPALWRVIGLLELAGVAGVLIGLKWPAIGIAAAVGLALLSVGAVVSHLRSSDGIGETAPAGLGLGLAVAAVVLYAV